MAIKRQHDSQFKTYFISFTCFEWLPLIEITNSYDTIYKWFKIIKTKYNVWVVAYVIMPNHLHLMLHFHKEHVNLNAVISNGKRFIAYEIIKRLKDANEFTLLLKLQRSVSERERSKGQLHKVFTASFDAKPVISTAFLLQKIDYIHYNPVRGKWMLAADYTEYAHSSASYYETGITRFYEPLHYTELKE